MTAALLSSVRVGSLEVRNRIWVAPMCQYSVDSRDGVPTDWHLVHLGGFAKGGAGLVIAEATAVSPEGRISPQDTGIWNDEQAVAWRRIADFIRGQGAAAGVQLAHAGRKASTYADLPGGPRGSVPLEHGGWTTVGPTDAPFDGYAAPRALDDAGREKVVADFAAAARRAASAGFDAIEVHAAHGYLLHQYLSPLSNTRGDADGGSLENRARLTLDVVRAVRAAAPDVAVLVRFSATDWTPGGLTAEEVAQVAVWAAEAGADFFDISSGGVVTASIPVGPGYQVPLAERVRAAGVEAGAVGLITEPAQAEAIVAGGRAEVVLLGRALLADPTWPLRAARELGAEAPVPRQYARAF